MFVYLPMYGSKLLFNQDLHSVYNENIILCVTVSETNWFEVSPRSFGRSRTGTEVRWSGRQKVDGSGQNRSQDDSFKLRGVGRSGWWVGVGTIDQFKEQEVTTTDSETGRKSFLGQSSQIGLRGIGTTKEIQRKMGDWGSGTRNRQLGVNGNSINLNSAQRERE